MFLISIEKHFTWNDCVLFYFIDTFLLIFITIIIIINGLDFFFFSKLTVRYFSVLF